MASVARLVVLSLFAGLALLGLALGAESQRESVLESDLEEAGKASSIGAAGNLIALTAALVALGVAGSLMLLSRLRVRRRLLPGLAVAGATYLGVLVGQTMWPFYVALLDQRYATLTNSLLAANLPASPSVVLAPLALALGALLGAGSATARLLGWSPRQGPLPPEALLRRQAAATLLAVPFLAIVAWGNVRLLLDLPDDRPGLGPYFVVLPAIALGALALAALAIAKTWQLGTYVRNARLASAAQESWQTLGRAEASVLALLAGLALAGTFLQPASIDDLQLGRVLGLSLRAHTQATVLLAIPMLPLLVLHRRAARGLADAPVHAATLDDAAAPLARLTLAGGCASVALAALATWTVPTVLWAWVLAVLPAAALAAWGCGPRLSASHVLFAAFLLWAIGNTVQATYDGGTGAGVLAFRTPPGFLALWRTLGAVLAAVALTRLAHGLSGGGVRRLPLAAGAGAAVAAVALLEMPLTAWLQTRTGVDAINVGSVVASLEPTVRAIVHTVAAVLALSSAILVALLHRPEWFGRRPRHPIAVVRPKGTGKTPA